MSRQTIPVTESARRSDLDWLHVLAVLLLVPFHSALVFMLDPGLVAYVKDTTQSASLVLLKDFLDRWQLELLFFIAGAASWFALGRRSSAHYVVERFERLLVPFLFGLLVLVPLMINVRWLGRPDGPSISEIYARFFTLNPEDLGGMSGTFTPAHLWFIMYLFVFSLVALPIFRLLRLPASQRALSALAAVPGAVYLFVIPLTLVRSVDLLGLGAKDPLYYLLVFLLGYMVTGQSRFQEAIDRYLWLSFALALVATVLPQVLPRGTLSSGTESQLYTLSQWTWVLTMLGAGHRWLNYDRPILHYAREATYPFYILHMPVDTLVAFYVIQLNAGVAAKYTLIVVTTTLVTLAVYELVIKHVDLLRFLFGMKSRSRVAHPQRVRPAPVHRWSPRSASLLAERGVAGPVFGQLRVPI